MRHLRHHLRHLGIFLSDQHYSMGVLVHGRVLTWNVFLTDKHAILSVVFSGSGVVEARFHLQWQAHTNWIACKSVSQS